MSNGGEKLPLTEHGGSRWVLMVFDNFLLCSFLLNRIHQKSENKIKQTGKLLLLLEKWPEPTARSWTRIHKLFFPYREGLEKKKGAHRDGNNTSGGCGVEALWLGPWLLCWPPSQLISTAFTIKTAALCCRAVLKYPTAASLVLTSFVFKFLFSYSHKTCPVRDLDPHSLSNVGLGLSGWQRYLNFYLYCIHFFILIVIDKIII